MTTSAFGPQGPNFTAVRPAADTDPAGGADTWAKDCTAPTAKDGTFLDASFFNVFIAQLRQCVRTARITLNNADDLMLYNSIIAIADARIALALASITIHADRGIKVATSGASTGYVESTLGDGTRDVLT